MVLKNKKKWLISIVVAVVLISAVFLYWFFVIAPSLTSLPKDFTYEAEVNSVDNFYDEVKGEFSGESVSATKFSYRVTKEQDGNLIIKNVFDVHKLTGELIFSVERLYGINPITGKHVAGFGDKNRDGYLFLPIGLKKGQPFTYWHINYDGPANMQFAGEETIHGLTVYRYETHYEGVDIDQTQNLTFLPGVGTTRGINLEPYLQLWVEPVTGRLINYKDQTTAYYYDLQTEERLHPWNKFSNTFKDSSITAQVEIAKQKKLFLFLVNLGTLFAIVVSLFLVFLTISVGHLRRVKKDIAELLKKSKENQIKLEEEQVKSNAMMATVSLQNVQLEKSQKATLNVLEDLKIEEKNSEDAKIAARNVLEDLSIEKAKVELARAKEEAILLSVGDGLIATDEKGNITLINKTGEKLLGKKSEEIIGNSFFEVISLEDEKGVSIPLEKRPLNIALAGGTTTTTTTTTGPTYYYRGPDKTKFPVAIMVTPIILLGKIIGTIEIFRDITKEKEIDNAKTEFVSLASHQLRTPLTDVSWHTEMILQGDVGQVVPKQKKYLEAIYQGNKRMIDLVNTLLDVSRLELGTFKVEPKPTDIRALAQSVLDEQKSEIEKKKIILTKNFNKDVPTFSTDPKLLRMVFQNLLANAVAYTAESGKIEFAISHADTKTILIKVSDTGYGIPKNQQDKIFTKFFRADNVREKDTDGTGLGLYIAKSIVENSGGKVWFESEENKGPARQSPDGSSRMAGGTTFYVTLPLDGVKKSALGGSASGGKESTNQLS